jgi:hypothetical protein
MQKKTISMKDFNQLSLLTVSGLFISAKPDSPLTISTINAQVKNELDIETINDNGIILESIHLTDEAIIIRSKGKSLSLESTGTINLIAKAMKEQNLNNCYFPAFTDETASSYKIAGDDGIFSSMAGVTDLGIFQDNIFFITANDQRTLRRCSAKAMLYGHSWFHDAETIYVFREKVERIGRISKKGLAPITMGKIAATINLLSKKVELVARDQHQDDGHLLGIFRLCDKIDNAIQIVIGKGKLYFKRLSPQTAS